MKTLLRVGIWLLGFWAGLAVKHRLDFGNWGDQGGWGGALGVAVFVATIALAVWAADEENLIKREENASE